MASLACGSSDDSSGQPADAATATDDAVVGQCPATVALTIGARCPVEGLLCAPEYTCNLVQFPLLCVCTDGLFVCTDGSGNSIAPGGTPACSPAADAGCPPDQNVGSSRVDLQACKLEYSIVSPK